jgi:hypothetical protein
MLLKVIALVITTNLVYIPPEERASFCTFVVVDDTVTHKVKWSIQADNEAQEFSQVAPTERCNHLPNWAIHLIRKNYSETSKAVEKLQKPMFQPVHPEPDPRIEAKHNFLLLPHQWVLLQDKKYLPLFLPEKAHPRSTARTYSNTTSRSKRTSSQSYAKYGATAITLWTRRGSTQITDNTNTSLKPNRQN